MEYTDRHRTFLQAISGHGCLEVSDALNLLNSINEKYEVESANNDDLSAFINEINAKLEDIDQKIKQIRHDVLKKNYVVFTNTIESEINLKQTFYTEMDREYFRLLLQEITMNEYSIERIVALNLISELKPKPFSKNHAEDLLEDWINLGYFIESDNLFYFGCKTLGEFSNYLAENFADYVKQCHLCLAAVLMGSSCDNCGEFFHCDCLRKAFSKHLHCPECKSPWSKPV